ARALSLELGEGTIPLEPARLSVRQALPRKSFGYELSLLLGGAVADNGSVSAAAAVETWLGKTDSRLAGGLGLMVTSPRELSVGLARARFMRIAARVGGRYRFALLPWTLDLSIAASPALFWASGLGFSTNYETTAFDLGLGVGVRAGRRIGPIH